MDASGGAFWRCRIHKDRGIDASPILDQGHYVPAADDKLGAGGEAIRKLLGHKWTHPIISPIRVADSRHKNSRPLVSRIAWFHERWIDSFRKWVEQEIQGS